MSDGVKGPKEFVDGMVGMGLAEIEKVLGDLSAASLARLLEHLQGRYNRASQKSFAFILKGLCLIEIGNRAVKGGGDE